MDDTIIFNDSAFKHEGVTEEDIRRAFDRPLFDELLTRTTPKVNPAVKGITARRGFKMFAVDDYSAEYITANALATRRTPSEVIGEMVRERIAATA